MSPLNMNSLDYFAGGVPAGQVFKMSLDDLMELVAKSKAEKITDTISGSNPAPEVCLIALVSYFEAFCKNEFASIINICPEVLNNFCSKRTDTAVNVKDLLIVGSEVKNKLGFILSEKYDFGTAKNINGLFMDLLYFTPFSKTEAKKYNRLLNDRNLIVHHAGIYTMKYHQQNFRKQAVRNRIFFDSLVVEKKDFNIWAAFIEKMVAKIVNNSYKSLSEVIKKEKIILSKDARGALDFLKGYKI